MIDVQEHFYDDDPRQGHPDVRTQLKDVCYFVLGNGLIQAAVQVAPSGEGTPLGLLIMDPDVLGKKREALTMDEDSGLERTMIKVEEGRRTYRPQPGSVKAAWSGETPFPVVKVEWESGDWQATERFFCPDRAEPLLVRQVTLAHRKHSHRGLRLHTGTRGQALEKELSLEAGRSASVWIRYRLSRTKKEVEADWAPDEVKPEEETVRHGQSLASVAFDFPLLDHFFRAAKFQLPAAFSRRGRMDGSIWQYSREWPRDQAMAALALTMLGERNLARNVFHRLLHEFVTAEGDTVDSSERRSPDEVELDQNGALLWALESYLAWTGDQALVRDSWDRVVAAADFPLKDVFRHPSSGLLMNRREFWERHKAHGVEKGMEMIHQAFVSLGLAAAGRMARLLARPAEAERWEKEAGRLKKAMLEDSRFSLVAEGRLIKRRGPEGAVQEALASAEEAHLPDEVPLGRPGQHFLNPDTSTALPIALEFVPAASPLARATLEDAEALWNQAWQGGGYGRYHITSEPDSPGPWPFPSLFMARAYAESGDFEKVWRVLHWLESLPSGKSSAGWFEFYGERVAPPFPQVGIVPWTWAEMIFLFIRHIVGARPEVDCLRLKPRLLPGLNALRARLPLRDGFLDLEVLRDTKAEELVTRSTAKILRQGKEEATVAYAEGGGMKVELRLR